MGIGRHETGVVRSGRRAGTGVALGALALWTIACGWACAWPSRSPEAPPPAPAEDPEGPATPDTPTPGGWPVEPGARWPGRCLLENVALHPEQPWLAAACTDSERELGAVLVFDGRAYASGAGTIRTSTPFDTYVGWSDPDLLQWHPDGARLATNLGTNGIALVDRARHIDAAFPDQTRDHGVGYAWVDDRVFTDTAAFFAFRPGDTRFDFPRVPGAPGLYDIAWNATIGAVVGQVDQGIAAFDPIAGRVVYDEPLTGPPGHLLWSPDGRWCVRKQFAISPAPDLLQLYDGDDGRLAATLTPSRARIDRLVWGPGGALAVLCHTHDPVTLRVDDWRVDLVRGGRIEASALLDPRRVKASYSLPEVSGIAWSRTGDRVALLLDGQEVRIVDGHTGATITSFAAPAPPIPAGLPSYYTDDRGIPGDVVWLDDRHLVRLSSHFVALWTVDGARVAELVVPVD